MGVTVVPSRRVAAEPDVTPAAAPRQGGGSGRLLAVCLATPARHSLLGDAAGLEDENDGEEHEAEREGEGGGGDVVAFMGARSQQSLRSALSASGWL